MLETLEILTEEIERWRTDGMIRELPETERPRERLLEQGSGSLTEAELIAVLLRTGGPGTSARADGPRPARDDGGLPGLLGATPQSSAGTGLGPAKAAGLLAALEIGRRLARGGDPERSPLTRPAEVARYLTPALPGARPGDRWGRSSWTRENRLLGEREIYPRHPRPGGRSSRGRCSRSASCAGASGVILFHTHPSGDPSPEPRGHGRSPAAWPRRREMVGVRLVDHLVLGGAGRWVSLREMAWSAW